jgi:23S rRNA pseudouridine1911/1915/1917 synthase
MNSKQHFYKKIYEDDSLLIVDKPQGLATATGAQHHLCEYLFDDYPVLAGVKGYKTGEGGLLNRLDNETGGLVFFAKSDEAFSYYSLQMKTEKVLKYYTALVQGVPETQEGTITLPIAHHFKNKKRMVIADGKFAYRGKPQPAVSEWKLLYRCRQGVVLEIMIKKGVRHQIRVHLAAAGMPVAGDNLYNDIPSAYSYHQLYATGVSLRSLEGEQLELKIEAPFLFNRIADG